ncbi:MerR family transcriptional regulator [Paenibacillus xylaniclasticus]|uniref:MerR family transcriptional regulator n=1 Tax=Paenibacillus xylaniclasticus TaxID=588083 RepID=UPI000FD824CD|nr:MULTISPECIES: MerR family transcriptional regulator [Paenibacillus]GFN30703.1 hypothetical protein PCURB6_09630 [Paenibacillus curdlanolyticus]
MKVQEVARRLGVTPRAVRFYEEKGLVHPHKDEVNGYRLYTEDDIERLRWIVTLRELGLPLASIAEVLESTSRQEGSSTSLLAKLDEARAQLFAEWRSATHALEALDTAVTHLQHGAPELQPLENAAAKLSSLRKLREAWQDRWQFDGLAAAYAVDAPLIHWSRRLKRAEYIQALKRAVEWLDPREEEHGLDLAAGTGNLTAILMNTGARMTAVEQSANMLAVYRERFPYANAKQGNMLALPLTSAAFHFIGCTFAFHYLESAQQLAALAEIDRVLLPGGRFVLTGLTVEHVNPSIQQHTLEDTEIDTIAQDSDDSAHLFEIDDAAVTSWLTGQGYEVVMEQLSEAVILLSAVKP